MDSIRLKATTLAKASIYLIATVSASSLIGCASTMSVPFSQAALPKEVQVPAGNKVMLETVGVGEITYECRAKANAAGQFEWVFVGPQAKLLSRSGNQVGTYYGPPATWEHNDSSKLTATQVAVAPAAAGSIPHQLVKANPATGKGLLIGTTFIQRTATQGGVAPNLPCDSAKLSTKEKVKYQADYIFWTAS
jgi:hypothetical protein